MGDTDITLPIVLVHLGRRAPRHLAAQIRRLLLQEHHVIVAVDSDSVASQCERHGATTFVVDVTEQRSGLASSMGRRMSFRDGFWAQTALRLDALAQVHQRMGCPVIHLENDVLLHPMLDTARLVQTSRPFAWSALAPDRDIGAILVAQDARLTAELAASVLRDMSTSREANEMQALAAYTLTRPADVELLPTSPSVDPAFFMPQAPRDVREALSRGAEQWSGVFDAAGIGQYLLGTDPRNRRGRYSLFTDPPDQWVRPSRFLMSTDSDGWPVLEVEGESFTVWSLHVHSKDLRAFDERQLRRILAERVGGPHTPQERFSFRGASSAARDALRRRAPARRRAANRG